jgi:hypothetical protein
MARRRLGEDPTRAPIGIGICIAIGQERKVAAFFGGIPALDLAAIWIDIGPATGALEFTATLFSAEDHPDGHAGHGQAKKDECTKKLAHGGIIESGPQLATPPAPGKNGSMPTHIL